GGKTSSVLFTIKPVPVATVTVAPASASIFVGDTKQLAVVTKDANGNELTGRSVSWVSDHPEIATVSSTGLVTGVAVGSATITATSEGKTGTSAITVTPIPVASVGVSLASASITVGQTTQASAVTRDANGNVLTGRVVAWSSST